jgi:hypothetical protein
MEAQRLMSGAEEQLLFEEDALAGGSEGEGF